MVLQARTALPRTIVSSDRKLYALQACAPATEDFLEISVFFELPPKHQTGSPRGGQTHLSKKNYRLEASSQNKEEILGIIAVSLA
jgi:hypothetical protein